MVAHLRAQVDTGSYTEMSAPINPYASSDPFSDPTVYLMTSEFVTIWYQSNHDVILQLRHSVFGDNHNQAQLPASPSGFSIITLSLRSDFKWLDYGESTLDLTQVNKLNFFYLKIKPTGLPRLSFHP